MRGRRALSAIVIFIASSGVWHQAHGAAGSLTRRPSSREAFYHVPTRAKMVALTFDDGPQPGVTPAIVALLRRYGAHATFFDVGARMLASPSLVAEELGAGNEVANHTFDHPRLMRLDDATIAGEVTLGDDAFDALGLPHPRWFRPPYGLAPKAAFDAAERDGERIVLWSVAIDRYALHDSVARAARRVAARVGPGDIILAHDCCPPYDRFRTVRVLEWLLPELTARGFRIVTVSELLAQASTR